MPSPALRDAALLASRFLLGAIFIIEGYEKIAGYAAAAAYMQKYGVTDVLLPLVIAVELLGGIMIVVGWQTRPAAFVLAGFCILAALLFHLDFASRSQNIQFLKNLAIAGGFLALLASGPGGWSLDGRKGH
jgi:putative oxidoreductase